MPTLHANKIVRSRAPLRISFGGGGTDVAPFRDLHGGLVINATINKFVYSTFTHRKSSTTTFKNADTGETFSLTVEDSTKGLGIESIPEGVRLHYATYMAVAKLTGLEPLMGLECVTFADAKNGSGLGTSSTCVVAMLKGYTELLGLDLDDHEIAELAWVIERIDCQIAGGKQDQYAATFGGFNLIEFQKDSTNVIPIRLKNWIRHEFESRIVLYYTGQSRNSGTLIKRQISAMGENDSDVLGNLHLLKQEAKAMKSALIRGNFGEVARSMNFGWTAKMAAAPLSVNDEMRRAYEAARDAGAEAGKVCGAGGGGYMLFLVQPTDRVAVARTLNSFGGLVENCSFTDVGCSAWTV